MPKAFTDCVKSGGKVRTVKPNPSTVIPICFKGGKSFAGEPKKVTPKK